MTIKNPLIVIEGALLTAGRPLKTAEISRLFDKTWPRKQIRLWLVELQKKWADSAVRLEEVAGGWRFVGSKELQPYLQKLSEAKPPKYSRSFMEILAIIAYRQPVTRGDIEDIRGVSINSSAMRQLQDRGWIDCVGHRDVPGRPALWGTTSKFLQDFSLKSLAGLPSFETVESKRNAGAAAAVSMQETQGEIFSEHQVKAADEPAPDKAGDGRAE